MGGAALLLALLAASPAAASQSLVLDLGDPANAAPTGALKSAPLAKGEAYTITVAGTGSEWPAAELTAPSAVCGTPEPSVVAASPGKPAGPAGVDAQTIFAAPAGSALGVGVACGPTTLPRNTASLYTGFEVSQAPGQWMRLTPIGGRRTTPRLDHTYVYTLVGTGTPVDFRFVDTPSDDNYGRLGISILTAAECASIRCTGAASGQGFQAGAAGDTRTGSVPVANPAAGSARPLPTCALTLRVRLRGPGGVPLRSATLRAGNRTLAKVTRTTLKRSITLRRLPATRFTVTAQAKTQSGRAVAIRRSIAGCRAPTSRTTTLSLR